MLVFEGKKKEKNVCQNFGVLILILALCILKKMDGLRWKHCMRSLTGPDMAFIVILTSISGTRIYFPCTSGIRGLSYSIRTQLCQFKVSEGK